MEINTNRIKPPMNSLTSRALTAAFLAIFYATASAQGPAIRLDRPEVNAVDENQVAMSGGKPAFTFDGISIGNKESELRLSVTFTPQKYGHSIYHNFNGGFRAQQYPTRLDVQSYEAHTGNSSELFYLINGQYVSYTGQGSTIVDTGGGYLYIRHDGAQFTYDKNIVASGRADLGSIVKAKFPNGNEINYFYRDSLLRSVVNNRGLQLKFTYGAVAGPPYALNGIVKITAINNSVEYCDPTAYTCSLAQNWPEATVSYGTRSSMPEHEGNLSTVTFVDAAGLSTQLTIDGYNQLVRVKERTSVSDNITYGYCRYTSPYNCYIFSEAGSSIVSGVLVAATNAGRAWTYDFTSSPNTGNYFSTATSLGPLGTYRVLARINARPGPLLSVSDAAGNSAAYEESDRNFPTSFSDSQGKSYSYSYDARGNLIAKQQVAVAGSGLPNILQSASYDVNCTNIRICNKPNWVRDGLGNQVDYTYDSTHGELLNVTSPPDSNGVRPQQRNVYAQRYAWVKNAAGNYVPASSPVWVLSQTSRCRTGSPSGSGAGCALGSADEVVTSYEYGPDAGPNNLWVRGQAVTAMDGGVSQTLRTCFAIDRTGNKVSETSPRAGLNSCP